MIEPHFRRHLAAILLCLVWPIQTLTHGQDASVLSPPSLDAKTADAWAGLVLKGIDSEFPNKPSVVYAHAEQVVTPREMFPAFYGCFDWHSSVHGHWLLTRLVRLFPEMESASRIRAALSEHLTKEHIQQETEFFRRDEQKAFERMYGWAWYLRLVMELEAWDDADAKIWRENCRPLEELLVARTKAYLPLLEFPIRTGEHPDTAFALGQILDYARMTKDTSLERLVIERAREFYGNDENYPVQYEPSGQDFFSSAWNEADLMRRVLSEAEFESWLTQFLPKLQTQLVDGTIKPVQVSDLTDGKLVHLAGLNLHRAWCMRWVVSSLAKSNPLRRAIHQSADAHLTAGLAYINSGHYEGDHWMATFGLYALTSPADR